MGLVRMDLKPRGEASRTGSVIAALAAAMVVCALFAASAMALSPSVGTKAASNVDYSTATLNGTVNPNGLETKTYFEYGPTTSYGTKTAEVSVGAGASALETAKAVSGLTPNTTYHYRVVATNADGTSSGGDRTFYVGWATHPAATIEGNGFFEDVACPAASDCFAVGYDKSGAIIQRWNGSEWKSQTPAKPAGATGTELYGVACTSSSSCVAVGAYVNSGTRLSLVEAWNGTEWKVQTSPNPASSTRTELRSVSCTASTECTAVGEYKPAEPTVQQTLAMRWNGSEWKIQTTPTPGSSTDASLESVSCASSTFCMAAGYYRDIATGKYVPLSLRWTGTEWISKNGAIPGDADQSWFSGVSCTSSTACTVVGFKRLTTGGYHRGMAQRWNGSEWSLQTTPGEGPEEGSSHLEGVVCLSSTNCTAVGYFPSPTGKNSPMRLQWNGSTWTLQVLPLPSGTNERTLSAVSCIASRGCESVGYEKVASGVVPLAMGNWRPAAPTVATTAASSVGEKTATVNGTANPNGSETKVYFEYGTTTSYGSKTAEFNLGSGTSAVEQGAALTGLSAATTYHYRIVGNNENPETSKGSDGTFRTTGPPTVSTSAAEVHSSGEGATLKGQVNPNGLSTTYQFEYGTSPGVFTNTVPAVAESAGSGTESKSVSYTVTGLTKGKTYYYRITATNSAGKSNGSESSFTTPSAAEATTGSAVKITKECATLQGTVKRNGLATKYWFEYGLTTSYGSKTSTGELAAGASSVPVETKVCGLSSGTLYHYRLVAENGLGTGNGLDQSLTTVAMALKAGGKTLEVGAPLKVFSSNFVITSSTGVKHSCAEAELSGKVTKNPGANASIEAPKLQNAGGAKCEYFGSGVTAQYSFPGAMAMEYTINEAGEGIALTGKFLLVATIYNGATKLAECEWQAEMSGKYSLFGPLEIAMTGSSTLVKGAGIFCFPSETMAGKFVVTSGGVAVEMT